MAISIKNFIGLYKRLWGYMSQYWGRFVISIIAMTVAAITEPLFARLMKPLIDKGFIDQDRRTIILLPIAVMVLFLVRGVATYINAYMTTWLSSTIVEKMRGLMFDLILRLPSQYYDVNNSGRIISRLTFDVTQIAEAGFNVITVTCRDGLTIIGLLVLLLYTNWRLTLFCVFTLPFVLVLIRILAYKLRKLSHRNQKQYGEMTQVATETIQGQKVVKLFGCQDYEKERFLHSVRGIKTNNVKQSSVAALNSGLSQFLVSCALAMILYFASSHSHANHFTSGDFVSFIAGMIMIFAPMKRITNVTQSLQKGLAAADSVFEFLDSKMENDNGKLELTPLQKNIIFKNVTFKHSTALNNALNNINLEIKAGSNVALVGMSGSGKTTLANLIPRFYNIIEGDILIDGVNIKEFTLASLRKNISLVTQDVFLFNDTVYNNIAYGLKDDSTSEQVIKAAKLANALEFIEHLPESFNTIVGENGVRLSGGQKQRLAIARALIKNAPILILDEATSALDNYSEKLVQDALNTLMKNKTTIIIAHRLSTIINADLVVVLDKGNIVEVGKHQELLSMGKVYSSLYKMQFHNQESQL